MISDSGRTPIYLYQDQKLIDMDRCSQLSQMKQLATHEGLLVSYLSILVICAHDLGTAVTVSTIFAAIFGQTKHRRPTTLQS